MTLGTYFCVKINLYYILNIISVSSSNYSKLQTDLSALFMALLHEVVVCLRGDGLDIVDTIMTPYGHVMDMVKVKMYLDIVVLSIIVLNPVIVLSLRAGRKLHGAAQPRLVSGDGRVGVEVVREGRTANMLIIRLLSLGLQTILIHGVS